MLKTKVRPEVGELSPNRRTCGEFTQFCFNLIEKFTNT